MRIAILLLTSWPPRTRSAPTKSSLRAWLAGRARRQADRRGAGRRWARPQRRPGARRGRGGRRGPRTRRARQRGGGRDPQVLDWLRRIDGRTRWTISVCTGAGILGAAGLLEGKRATSNWLFLDRLPGYGAEPVGGRWVEDGKTLTAAGVTAGIDMALHLVDREAGPEVAQAVQLGVEYDPDPPFDSGSREGAAGDRRGGQVGEPRKPDRLACRNEPPVETPGRPTARW